MIDSFHRIQTLKSKDESVLVIGCQGTGKSSLIALYTNSTESPPPTIGVEYITHNSFHEPSSKTVNLQIWDMSGQEKYKRLILQEVLIRHFRRAQAAILVFDISDKKSFENLITWVHHVEEICGTCFLVCVGNKADLVEREVSVEEGEEWARELRMQYFETSKYWELTKNDRHEVGIGTIFEEIFDRLVNRESELIPRERIPINEAPQERKRYCLC